MDLFKKVNKIVNFFSEESKILDDITTKWEKCVDKIISFIKYDIMDDIKGENIGRWPLFIMLCAAIVCFGFSTSFERLLSLKNAKLLLFFLFLDLLGRLLQFLKPRRRMLNKSFSEIIMLSKTLTERRLKTQAKHLIGNAERQIKRFSENVMCDQVQCIAGNHHILFKICKITFQPQRHHQSIESYMHIRKISRENQMQSQKFHIGFQINEILIADQ